MLWLVLTSVLLITAAGSSVDEDDLWQIWKWRHNKVYNSATEDVERRSVWMQRVADVAAHNLRYDLGLESYSLAANAWADRTDEEMRGSCLFAASERAALANAVVFNGTANGLPEEVNWLSAGYVTSVKDQQLGSKKCGSCYAFVAAGALEGQWKKHSGQLVDLSVEQLVSFTQPFGNLGCEGGNVFNCFKYLEENKMVTDRELPYTAEVSKRKLDPRKGLFYTTAATEVVRGGDEQLLKALVARRGPATTGIHGMPDMALYHHGVYRNKNCKNGIHDRNHGLLIVGYGKLAGGKYWLLKNSHGTSFGDRGYMRIARDEGNMCGVATVASVPDIR